MSTVSVFQRLSSHRRGKQAVTRVTAEALNKPSYCKSVTISSVATSSSTKKPRAIEETGETEEYVPNSIWPTQTQHNWPLNDTWVYLPPVRKFKLYTAGFGVLYHNTRVYFYVPNINFIL